MKKNLIKKYIYNMSYQVLALLIPLVTTPYLARVLGPSGVGISAYTITIVTYFILFGSLGMSIYGQREIAYVQDDKEKKTAKFVELFALKTFFMIITIIIYFIFISNTEYEVYYKVLIFELVANVFDISWFFQGIENFKVTVIKNLIIKLLSLLCIFIFVKTSNDLNIYLLIYGGSTLIGNLTLWLHLKNELCKISLKNVKVFKNLKYVILFLIPQIANKLYAIIDKTMLGMMIPNIAETGYYEQSDKIVKIWITVITALGTVIMPRIANYFAKKDKEKINSLMVKSVRYVCFCAFPLIFGLIAIAPNIIPIYLGSGYEKSIILIQVLAPIILIIGLNNIIGNQYLLPTGQQKKYTIAVIIGTIVNFALNFILIRVLSSYGAAIATIISEIVVLLVEICFVKKQFNFKIMIRNSLNYIISSAVMFIVIFFLKNISSNLIVNCIVQFLAGLVTYLLMLTILKDEFFKYIVDRIKVFLNKKKLNG
ncbi:MAG: polysaccharide biosynthesis C-terminal domain-containing protein [Clostridia bacterium]|nr:polysaccharide biosynthesis C-terminal domain-containing protein [Clostridia bacterium]